MCYENTNPASVVIKSGLVGGSAGLVGGLAGLLAASRRFHTIRNLTLPMKTFLVTSSGTFFTVIAGDHGSREFETSINADKTFYGQREQRKRDEHVAGMSVTERIVDFAHREKYKIIGATWIASMIGSWALVGRNPYLTGQQKIVQARVYAQGLTLAVLCASAAFEIHDQKKGQGILDKVREKGLPAPEKERYEGEDMWKEMVVAEDQRIKEKEQFYAQEQEKQKQKQEHA